ncbi:methyl-accepting chemotaxis protein [Gammaproteobacteria bacterium]
MLNNTTVRVRLILLVGILLVTMAAISIVGAIAMNASNNAFRTVYENRVMPLRQLSEIGIHMQSTAMLILDAGTNMTEQTFTVNLDIIENDTAAIDQLWTGYLRNALTLKEQQLATVAKQASNQFHQEVVMPAKAAIKQKFDTNALSTLLALAPQVKEKLDIGISKLAALQQFQETMTQTEFEESQNRFTLMLTMIAILGLVGGSCGVIFSIFIVRRLIAELGGEPRFAATIANRVARGDVSTVIAVKPGDTSSLMYALNKMQQSFIDFATAQAEMTQAHETGAVDHQMPNGKFPGIYGRMADSMNEVVQSHIAISRQVVDVVSCYAQGDFSVNMSQLPGRQMQLTVAVDSVKNSLLAINNEIWTLVDAALRGDFSARGNVDRYQYDFYNMVSGLNQFMEICETGLDDIAKVLNALSRGDLTIQTSDNFQGTFGKLKEDAKTTVAKLTTIIKQIQHTTDTVNNAAMEIANGNNHLSRRTEEQIVSLGKTSLSMADLTVTIKRNTDRARQANQLAVDASSVAVCGGEVVNQVVQTMGEIDQSSKRIVDIIGVIDGIAFQTNILALNAAVEAARAGEQGRGFAVVATEVRSLAQRSATAAREIKQLIEDSVNKVKDGAQLVDLAGRSMEEIVGSIHKVTTIMTEISTNSKEQACSIEQINQSLQYIDKSTKQNATLVEQAALSAERLKGQANNLSQTVSTFHLNQMAANIGAKRIREWQPLALAA